MPPSTRSTCCPTAASSRGNCASEGFADLRDVPVDRLTREDHRRIWRATANGAGRALRPAPSKTLAALPWPRYYLDFETVGPAVPLWPGTRPYQKIPMQWSCHRQDADGTLAQLPPFLDTRGRRPAPRVRRGLVAAIGDTGPIMVYNASFERSVLLQLADAFPDLAPALHAMADRLFDLLPFVRAHYYHPAMMGSWSIKRVLPTIAPDLDYANLDDVQSGDMVEPVYFEMIDPATPPNGAEALRGRAAHLLRARHAGDGAGGAVSRRAGGLHRSGRRGRTGRIAQPRARRPATRTARPARIRGAGRTIIKASRRPSRAAPHAPRRAARPARGTASS